MKPILREIDNGNLVSSIINLIEKFNIGLLKTTKKVKDKCFPTNKAFAHQFKGNI